MKQSYSYNGPNYYLNDMEAIACLTGYPLVFLASTLVSPWRSWKKSQNSSFASKADGFTITSNAGAPDSTILITWKPRHGRK
ncbi:MAG: hypothetical protein ACLU4N_15880 [Butyricimonas faecihominis]